MIDVQQKLQEIKENGYNLSFNDIFNKAFENYKKIALFGGLSFLVLAVAFFSLVIFFYVFLGNFLSLSEILIDLNISKYEGIGRFIYLFVIIIINAILSPFYAGIIQMAHNAKLDNEVSVSNCFEFYKNKYFKELFLVSFLISSVCVVLSNSFQTFGIFYIGPILSYIIRFFMILVTPFIIFGNLKAVDAIKASFTVTIKQFPLIASLIIVSVLVICLGFFGLCIGIFFSFPLLFSLNYVLYEEIVGIKVYSEIDEIGLFED